MNPKLARRNLRLGLALLAIAIVLFAGSIIVAEVYNRLAA
jgi:hypothetical protein